MILYMCIRSLQEISAIWRKLTCMKYCNLDLTITKVDNTFTTLMALYYSHLNFVVCTVRTGLLRLVLRIKFHQ